jgi:hypothetical protein
LHAKAVSMSRSFVSSLLYTLLIFALSNCSSEEKERAVVTPPVEEESELEVAGAGLSNELNFSAVTPLLIDPDQDIDQIYLEVFNTMLAGNTVKMSTAWGKTISLYDDGTHGDKIPSDGIYTAKVSKASILNVNTREKLNRPFIGSIPTDAGELSIFAEVWSNDIPLVSITNVSSTIQQTEHLVNLAVDYISINNLSAYLKSFYQHYEDKYDFVNVIFPGYNYNRHHMDVSMNISGIGKDQYDMSEEYGSGGYLKGINVFPSTAYYDGASTAYQHELGHQWVNFLNGLATESAIPHWPLSDLASSIMGYSPGGGQGLQFPYVVTKLNENEWALSERPDPPVFNDLELYLMGLISPDEVEDHIVFDNPNQTVNDGAVLQGPVTTIKMTDLITKFGVRHPDHVESQKVFKIATLIISRKLLTQKEMSFYDYYTTRAELHSEVKVAEGHASYLSKPFYLSTDTKAQLDTSIQ